MMAPESTKRKLEGCTFPGADRLQLNDAVVGLSNATHCDAVLAGRRIAS